MKIKLTKQQYTEIRLLYNACSTDRTHRLALLSLFYDSKKKRLVGTDGHILRIYNIDLGDEDMLIPRKNFLLNQRQFNEIYMDNITPSMKKYCTDKQPEDSLFGLKPACISNKIRLLAKKANVDIHTHSLRHYFGTKLVEKGANIRAVQELMGHACLGTTEVYIGVTAKHLEDAISLLEG